MDETLIAAVDQPTANDLISFLKAIPDGRYRRGVRYPRRLSEKVSARGAALSTK
jgi:hypothetical protein